MKIKSVTLLLPPYMEHAFEDIRTVLYLKILKRNQKSKQVKLR